MNKLTWDSDPIEKFKHKANTSLPGVTHVDWGVQTSCYLIATTVKRNGNGFHVLEYMALSNHSAKKMFRKYKKIARKAIRKL